MTRDGHGIHNPCEGLQAHDRKSTPAAMGGEPGAIRHEGNVLGDTPQNGEGRVQRHRHSGSRGEMLQLPLP